MKVSLTTQLLSLVLLCMVMCMGCSESEPPKELQLDDQVSQQWMPGRQLAEAIPFFEKGGCYMDTDATEKPRRDKTVVLPFLKEFEKQYGLRCQVLLDDPHNAFAVIVEAPASPDKRREMRAAFRALDSDSQMILDNWGQKWLSLDFMGQPELDVLRATGGLEELRQELTDQK